jgi:hypothetical protein
MREASIYDRCKCGHMRYQHHAPRATISIPMPHTKCFDVEDGECACPDWFLARRASSLLVA